MIIATVQIQRTSAQTLHCQALPVGAVGLQVAFEFADTTWRDLSKTVVFRNNSMVMDAILVDGCAVIPHELLNKVADPIYAGVYGTDSNNNLAVPTVWAKLGNISSASTPSNNISSDVTLPYWAQIQEQVEDLRIKISQFQNSSGSQNSGDGTGPSTSLIYASVMYQESDSGTVIPTGIWHTDIPAVVPGKFLWTRITQQFSTGDPIIAYSVSRMGADALISVCKILPDDTGNIALTPSDIGALSANGGTLTGSINMNGQKLIGLNAPGAEDEAATKGYADQKLSMELIWENASPSSAFPTQTVSMNTAPYQLFYIECIRNTGSSIKAAEVIRKNQTVMMFSYNVSFYYRPITPLTNGIKFSQGYKYSGSEVADDTVCIPVRVYGIKGVN